MQATHRSRRFGRLMAAWLLLWFLAMSAAPLAPLSAAVGSGLPASRAGDAKNFADCGAAGHHHHHEDEQAAPAPDACAASPQDVHAGHGAGSVSHCPLCLHGAAPPPLLLAALAAADAPAAPPVQSTRGVHRARTDVPPPARGPPARSCA